MRYDLIEERLHAEAAARVGADDFGDDLYRPGVRRYLEALAEDNGLDADGVLEAARAPVVRALAGRLHAERGWRETPAHADVPIRRPIFIVGLPRSGTTALHQLLASDPQFQGIEHWLVEAPMVRPPRGEWAAQATFHEASERAEALGERFRTVHWVAPEEYDECIRVHLQGGVSNHFGSQRSVPGYDRWFLAQDQRPAVQRLARNYRLIGSATDPSRTWLLKNPSHLFNLDAILDEFPDARIVLTHRDPLSTVPSVCSLLLAMRRAEGDETADPLRIGAREQEIWGAAVERLAAARARRPDAFHDVYHADLTRDPLGVARGIYGRFGLELAAEAEQQMEQWVADVAPTRRGAHRYQAGDFGLERSGIAERFADYRRDHGFAALD